MSLCFCASLLKGNHPDLPGRLNTNLSAIRSRLMQETHHFFKPLQRKPRHSCSARSYPGHGCVVYLHSLHGPPATFTRTAVINQRLMILVADMRGAAELFLLIILSDSPVCVCVCFMVPKGPCFLPVLGRKRYLEKP